MRRNREGRRPRPGDSAWVPNDYMRRPGEEVIVEEVFEDGVAVFFFDPPATGFEFWEFDELEWDYYP